MALASACFDASGTGADAEDLCLAGYIFEKESALAFDLEWRAMLAEYELPYFHMKEIAMQDGGIYGHLDEDQRDLAAREAIRIIKTHASQGIAISVEKSAAAELRNASIWHNPYSFISGQVLFGVRAWVERTGFEGDVAYIFEAGDEGVGQAMEAAHRVMQTVGPRQAFRIKSFTTALKVEETPLQAADMLAWHWLKRARNLRKGNRKLRGDFKSLLEVPTDVHHYDQSAAEFLAAIRQMDLLA